jgi:predicted pyridoxine 5'-phosphate oxidase superfamily flavin-nucleotide-binding protein
VIEPDIVELMESPCALIVGTVDTDGLPDATRGWGVQVLDGGTKVRLLLAANATTTMANLRSTRRIALTATHFVTLQSVQVKGVALVVEGATDADRARFERFCAGCVRALHDMGDAPEQTILRLAPSDVFACIITVDELFDQTPGPEAGARLTPAGAKS